MPWLEPCLRSSIYKIIYFVGNLAFRVKLYTALPGSLPVFSVVDFDKKGENMSSFLTSGDGKMSCFLI
jgi:hypothetical protein